MTDSPAPLASLPQPAVVPPAPQRGPRRWFAAAGFALLAALCIAALALVWSTQRRVKTLESELVRRQQDSATQAAEARLLSRQAENSAREAAAKLALLEARVAETSLQRTQLEELMQQLARSRDDNVLTDVEAMLRVAMQQAAITGSAEPLVLTLKQADERLARYNQPRLDGVRRAVAEDLERVRLAGSTDVTVLTLRLDEVVRQVDELPLLASPDARNAARVPSARAQASPLPAPPGASAPGWRERIEAGWERIGSDVWHELKGLVRVTRIDRPDAMLLAPEQGFFLRENLKLRLLNARLSLLSRQFGSAQADLRDAQTALDRWFDRNAVRVAAAGDVLRQVAAQARTVNPPRPDATLAAIATASAGR